MEPSPSNEPHEQRGPSSNKHVAIAIITDCPTITVHAGKHYEALTDSGAAISVDRYSTYQSMDNSLKTAIQSIFIHLNTADESPMTALGITTLQLQIADFKLLHTFIVYDRLPNTKILFGIDAQKKFALSYAGD